MNVGSGVPEACINKCNQSVSEESCEIVCLNEELYKIDLNELQHRQWSQNPVILVGYGAAPHLRLFILLCVPNRNNFSSRDPKQDYGAKRIDVSVDHLTAEAVVHNARREMKN